MNFSYNLLQSFFEKKLPNPEKLAEVLTMHFAEVEEVIKKQKDFILAIDVRPNRAGDCFSHTGIAREISAILGYSFKEPQSKITEKNNKNKEQLLIKVKENNFCYRYTAQVISGIKVAPSPKWLKQRLEACGLKPINNIVDIANYVMLETGQPLHAFDAEKIEKNEIIVRFARKNEKIITLDNKKIDLKENILIIADEKEPLAIAGIKGGKKAEIDQRTKTIILESANFNSLVIRRASNSLNLKTDASLRFEHGLDPNLTKEAIFRASYLIKEIAKGNNFSNLIDFYPKKILPKKIRINLKSVKGLLGISVPEKEIKRILKSLDFNILAKEIEIPTKRQDIFLAQDLIEEIGRIFGYYKILAKYPNSELVVPKNDKEVFYQEKVKDILNQAGFTETYNYSFFSQKEIEIFNLLKKDLIELKNPLSQEQKYLRTSLVPGIINNVFKNIKLFSEIMIFEIGNVFKSPKEEKTFLAGAILNKDFIFLKSRIEFLFKKLGINNISYTQLKSNSYYSLNSAEIKINGQGVGFLGEVSKNILNIFEIKSSLSLFNIDFEKLLNFVSEDFDYQPISKYPSALRDIAVLVLKQTKVEDVLEKIKKAGGKLIKDINLFDIFEGGSLPQDKKNLAFRITFQAENKTLSSVEIDNLQNKIIKLLEKNPGWLVRK